MPNQPARDRPRIMFICSQELANDLQARADREKRSRSNLIEVLLTEIMYGQSVDSIEHHSKGKTTKEEEPEVYTPILLLNAITEGRRPSDEEVIDVAQNAGIDSRKLLELRDRLFPQQKTSRKGAKNAG